MKNIDDLKIAYANQNLTNFLRKCTYYELCYFESAIECSDEFNSMPNILDAIENEFNNRQLSKKVSAMTR